MAFAYSSYEELSLPISLGHSGKLIDLSSDDRLPQELPADDLRFHELPVDDIAVDSCAQRRPKKAPRPNKASRAFRHAQLAARQFIRQRQHTADAAVAKRVESNEHLPLSVIELVLSHLDVRGVAQNSEEDGAWIPECAGGLYNRLVYSRHAARRQAFKPLASWLLRSCDPAARFDAAFCVTWTGLPQLLRPIIEDMRACLSYIEAFQSCLDLETEGCDYWLDLTHLRECVFRLTGFWPHDIKHDEEAWAFGLPEVLIRLLYPQCGRFDHADMSMNLDEVIVGPAWNKLMKLEAIIRLHEECCP
ncbi:hypothetical protein KVR01_003871 [Diaporthe batatas]|uniref:uncharacterized protein n=1 Tax=Diaporthe batatas TaxID=748121 RepID=UPI001D04A923|nr:uncharacterized protein KVR01_003871 [Diaporthe batatas]KAG8168182.1 hypothetical protein KVR01_003871 [Diaporthe batatas]